MAFDGKPDIHGRYISISQQEWNIKLPVPDDVARRALAARLLFDTQDFEHGVVWIDVNGRVQLPYCRPVLSSGFGRPARERTRGFPADALRAGANAITYTIRPWPGLPETAPLYTNSLGLSVTLK